MVGVWVMQSKRGKTAAEERPLTLEDLPPVTTQRWVASRKELVVRAVEEGLLSLDEALARYGLSQEEFALWQTAIKTHGTVALKVTLIRKFR